MKLNKEELDTKMCGELQETICTWDNIYRSCQEGWETFKPVPVKP